MNLRDELYPVVCLSSEEDGLIYGKSTFFTCSLQATGVGAAGGYPQATWAGCGEETPSLPPSPPKPPDTIGAELFPQLSIPPSVPPAAHSTSVVTVESPSCPAGSPSAMDIPASTIK